QRLHQATALLRTLGPLRVPGGTVPRQVFLTALPDLVRELRVADYVASGANGLISATTTGEVQPFTGHTGLVLTIAVSPDGRQALSGSADKTLRLWDLATGRELRRLEGHSEEVLAVVFSVDGRRALSGGQDRTVRLWDLPSGRELRCLRGHTDRVSGVTF